MQLVPKALDGDAEALEKARAIVQAAQLRNAPDEPTPNELLQQWPHNAETIGQFLALAGPVLGPPPFGAPLPDPVLWQAGTGYRNSLLAVGEVAVLSGEGGTGKSTLALALAHAARSGGDACGLRVAEGHVALVSYEDSGPRIAHRMSWYGPPDEWQHVQIAPAPEPLWQADPADRRLASASRWSARFWAAVHELGARLVVIDPASVALLGADHSDAASVRAFLTDVSEQAERAGCGVLLVAHDTKAARSAARSGEHPGPGAIAGSSQWHDAARGVLYLARESDDRRRLTCVKSNHGHVGWHVDLTPRVERGTWRGLELVAPVAVNSGDRIA